MRVEVVAVKLCFFRIEMTIETQDIKTKKDALTVSLPILSMMEGFKLDDVHPQIHRVRGVQ